MWQLTLDLDCILDLIDPGSAGRFKLEMERLASLADQGLALLYFASTIWRELDRGMDPVRHARHFSRLNELPLRPAPGVFRLDVSRLDGPDTLGGDTDVFYDSAIREILVPSLRPDAADVHLERRIADVDHCLAHVRADNDVFVTGNTRDFTDSRRERLSQIGVVVMTPPEIVTYISESAGE